MYKQVADYLHSLILSGDLAKGEQLPSEVDLAEMLNVSRLTVPEDVSLVGFDSAGEFYPDLSTVEQPLQAMAEKALSLISETIRGKVYRNHTFLYDESFVDRGSVKNLN